MHGHLGHARIPHRKFDRRGGIERIRKVLGDGKLSRNGAEIFDPRVIGSEGPFALIVAGNRIPGRRSLGNDHYLDGTEIGAAYDVLDRAADCKRRQESAGE